jgi:ribose 5-phosphate isomerase B
MNPAETPIAIGADHAGVALKDSLRAALEAAGHPVRDFGTHGDGSVDYPDFGHQVAQAVEAGEARFGVLVCGTGIGMALAANRHPDVRAVVVHSTTEARLTRAHNDANIACFGSRTMGPEEVLDSLSTFLTTPYEGGRHARRVAKINLPAGQEA